MKIFKIYLLSIVLVCLLPYTSIQAQNLPARVPSSWNKNEPWNKNQLMEPAVLAAALKGKAAKPMIFNIGVVENIPGAKKIGAASEGKYLVEFEKTLQTLPKNTAIVVYCGCCPFNKCPNIRPAVNALKKKGFTNWKLLNLTTNIQTDWISKGYPVEKN